MASLMENLIVVLENECKVYDELLALSYRKTPIIVSENLEELAKITDEEQLLVSQINHIEKQRNDVMKDIANVLNRKLEDLKLANLIQMMGNRPEEQRKLSEVYDKLRESAKQMERVNRQNSELLESALEMVRFNMNLIQSANTAPKSANYNKGAYSADMSLGTNRRSFDAKQ